MKINDSLNRIEKTLKILFIICLCFTVLSNGRKIYINRQNAVYKSNTEESNLQLLSDPTGIITLELEGPISYPRLEVLVNGEYAMSFENNKHVVIEVKDRDVVEIKGTMYEDEIKIKIIDISSEIKKENIKQQVTINRNIVSLGFVRL